MHAHVQKSPKKNENLHTWLQGSEHAHYLVEIFPCVEPVCRDQERWLFFSQALSVKKKKTTKNIRLIKKQEKMVHSKEKN